MKLILSQTYRHNATGRIVVLTGIEENRAYTDGSAPMSIKDFEKDFTFAQKSTLKDEGHTISEKPDICRSQF